MIHDVFVDADMVLADFITGVERHFNVTVPDGFGYDVARYFDRTWDVLKYDLDEEFYSSLPKMPWAQSLMKWLTHEFDNVYILTSLEPIAGHINGRLIWLGIWFPEYMDKLIVTKHKHLLARSTTLLIDDYPPHCKAWRARRGTAVEVPSRWKGPVGDYNIIEAVAQAAGVTVPHKLGTE